MSILIKGMEMPTNCNDCPIGDSLCCGLMPGVPVLWKEYTIAIRTNRRHSACPLVPVPPHGDLIDRDALIKDGWLNLHKEVMRMGGYAIHELPLKNPSIPVIIPAEEGE